MPDEFPTLEVVAFIGVLAALVGMLQLRRGLREIPQLAQALESALRGGDLARARALTGAAEGAAFVRVGAALLDVLGRARPPSEREVKAALAQAHKRAASAAQRARARDLVVAAVLIGATAYAVRSSLDVGRVFYSMLGAAIVMTALGPMLRRSLLDAVVSAGGGLERAASAYLALKASGGQKPCPECGSGEILELGRPSLEAVRELGLGELSVCRHCGLVSGHVADPGAIALDEARGVRLRPAERELESSAEPDAEHQG